MDFLLVDPEAIDSETVLFGATVTIRDEDDIEKTYSIVGTDEADVSAGKISYLSPLGAALLRAKAKEGDWVTFRSPKGEQDIEVVKIAYQLIG